jgi:hypothetical protein
MRVLYKLSLSNKDFFIRLMLVDKKEVLAMVFVHKIPFETSVVVVA